MKSEKSAFSVGGVVGRLPIQIGERQFGVTLTTNAPVTGKLMMKL